MDSPPGADHVVLHDFAAPVLGYCREGDPHRSGGRIALEITAVTEAGTGLLGIARPHCYGCPVSRGRSHLSGSIARIYFAVPARPGSGQNQE